MSEDRRPTVLVVDDELANRVLVRAYLQNGYEVLEAADGPSALKLLAGTPVDLVLLDVMMPQMSGIEVCSIVKKTDEDGPYQPIILLTALGAQEDRIRGLEAGADDFLTKPVDRHELLLRVKAFVKLRRQDERIRQQVHDLAERDRIITQQLDELRSLDSLKDDLVALMVHDLRNPLQGIVGNLEMIAMTAGDEQMREDAVQALQASGRLREILEDVLKVRMLESGAVRLHREIVEAGALMQDAINSISGAARLREVEIAHVKDPLTVRLTVDRKLILRAIENLLTNALKYSPRGAVVEAVVRETSSAIEIEVSDRGQGIPDDLKQHLFEKFGSIEATRGEMRQGIGLGLYLVRLVADAHGGRALVRDREGGGTAFSLLLPTDEPRPS
ncbi:MAG TPA: hybrid sensor histidine kinase/response regulator [Polyangia bacterium]|jgi:signal transduction histidine kinase|nr:hybrid sensor histidine kinase/response regulator [Polyangia bacterium]